MTHLGVTPVHKCLSVLDGEEPVGARLLREECTQRKQPFNKQQCKFFVRPPIHSGEDMPTSEEICTYKNKVLWSSGRHLRKRFTTPLDVLQVTWTYLHEYGQQLVLCLLQKTILSTLLLSGEVHHTPLPQPCSSVWPLPEGLLVVAAEELSVFVLTHPLEDLQPVLADSVVKEASGSSYTGWSGEAVVWSSTEVPYVATYNKIHRRLALWRVDPAPPRAASILQAVTDLPVSTPGAPTPRVPPRTPASSTFAPTPLGYNLHTPMTGGLASSVISQSSVRRPSVRTPEGYLASDIFNPTPRAGPPAVWNAPVTPKTQATATSLGDPGSQVPHADPAYLFKLVYHEVMLPGAEPQEGVLVTDDQGGPLLALLCSGSSTIFTYRLGGMELGAVRRCTCIEARAMAALLAPMHLGTPASLPSLAARQSPGSGSPPLSTLSSTPAGSGVPQRQLLVVKPSGTMVLMRGTRPFCTIQCNLPPPKALASDEAALGGGVGVKVAGDARCYDSPDVQTTDEDVEEDMEMDVESDDGSQAMAISPAPSLAAGGSDPPSGPQPEQPSACLATVVRLTSHYSDKVTLNLSDGRRLLCQLPLRCCSPLPQLALSALRVVLDEDTFLRLLAEVMIQPGSCSGELQVEYQAFAQVLLKWCVDPSSLGEAASQGPAGTSPFVVYSREGAGEPLRTTPTTARKTRTWMEGARSRFASSPAAVQMGGLAKHHGPTDQTPVSSLFGVTYTTEGPMAMNPLLMTPSGTPMSFATSVGASIMGETPSSNFSVNNEMKATSTHQGCMKRAPDPQSLGDQGASLPGYSTSWDSINRSPAYKALARGMRFAWMDQGGDKDLGNPIDVNPGGTAGNETTSLPEDHGRQVLEVLLALHSLYEDLKMNTLMWPLLTVLGPTLARLAYMIEAYDYQDYYARDLGTQVLRDNGMPHPSAPNNCASNFNVAAAVSRTLHGIKIRPPADMHQVLFALLCGSSESSLRLPLLVDKGSSVVKRSCHLVQVYQKLSRAARSCAEMMSKNLQGGLSSSLESASQQRNSPTLPGGNPIKGDMQQLLQSTYEDVVLTLSQQQWDLTSLDTLPQGIRLPLQEAAQKCRSNPPQGWPLSAYILVGREDIAATLMPGTSSPTSLARGMAARQSSPKDNMRMDNAATAGTRDLSTATTPAGTLGIGNMGPPQRHPMGLSPNVTPSSLPLVIPSTAVQGPVAPPSSAISGRTPRTVVKKNPIIRPTAIHLLPYTQRLSLPASLADVRPFQNTSPPSSGNGAPSPSQSGAANQLDGSYPATSVAHTAQSGQKAYTGTEGLLEGWSRLRFGRDNRLKEVCHLLSSASPTPMVMDGPEGDPDLPIKQQAQLLLKATRTLALPLGRGPLTLGTWVPLPSETLRVPILCLTGVIPEPHRATVHLDVGSTTPAPGGGAMADLTAWPEFHNGVAAGLRMAPEGAAVLTRSWIVYHKPDQPSYSHAGLIMALGLTGHLTRMPWTDLYRYLSDQHAATTIGVILGLSAAKQCTMDPSVTKMLFLHLPARHPHSFPEIDLSPLVQATALLGLGLVYQGSCHRLMTEIMLEEVCRGASQNKILTPGGAGGAEGGVSGVQEGAPDPTMNNTNFLTQDVEGYGLAAGAALGLICLGRGRQAAGLRDLMLEQQLTYLMVGGAGGRDHAGQGGAHRRGVAGTAGGPLFAHLSGWDKSWGPDPLQGYPPLGQMAFSGEAIIPAIPGSGGPRGGQAPPLMNLNVSSPAATLALTLMYLRTNDHEVADAFVLPTTSSGLDYVRPDFLLLRVLGRSLVMWDSIQPSGSWVESQLPDLLRINLPEVLEGMAQAGVTGRPASTSTNEQQAVAEAHINAIAGACMAIGLKYAGSRSQPAYSVLCHYIRYILSAKRRAPEALVSHAVGVAPDKQALETCLDVVVLAVSLVMAGTGHLPTFRLLQSLNKRVPQAPPAMPPSHSGVGSVGLNYGHHMAVNMAMGFLFMGGGYLTFGTSPRAVAALLIALYPQFPLYPADNRCHLQALRHLYVLATEPRCVDAVEVDSHRKVYVPLEVKQAVGTKEGKSRAMPQQGNLSRPGLSAVSTPGAMGVSFKDPMDSYTPGSNQGLPKIVGFRNVTPTPSQGVAPSSSVTTSPTSPTAGPQDLVTCTETAPCLLPEQQKVRSVRVLGPRYWPLALHTRGKTGQRLYQQRVIFVKKKAGSLPYADDPSGIRSLLSGAYHRPNRLFPPDPTGKLEDNTRVPALSLHMPEGNGGFQQLRGSSLDIVHLCYTFSADPFIMAFALYMCPGLLAGQLGAHDGNPHDASLSQLLGFCHSALYECITQEKPFVLPWYISLYCLAMALHYKVPARRGATDVGQPLSRHGHNLLAVKRLTGGVGPLLGLWSLKMMMGYYQCSIALAEQWCAPQGEEESQLHRQGEAQGSKEEVGALAISALLQPGFLSALWQHLLHLWSDHQLVPLPATGSCKTPGGTPYLLQQYLQVGALPDPAGPESSRAVADQDEALWLQQLLSAAVSLGGVPAPWKVTAAVDRAKREASQVELGHTTASSLARSSLPRLASLLPTMSTSMLLAIASMD